MAEALQGRDPLGASQHHGWREPDNHDGAFHGGHRFACFRPRPRRAGAPWHQQSRTRNRARRGLWDRSSCDRIRSSEQGIDGAGKRNASVTRSWPLSADPAISIRNLYKIFGFDPQSMLAKVKAGMSKAELLAKHGH